MICLKLEYVDIVIEAKDRMVRLGDWKLSYEPLADGPLYRLFNIREDAACSAGRPGAESRGRGTTAGAARGLDGRGPDAPARSVAPSNPETISLSVP